MKEIKINDIKSLAHTQWNCKYHIVFAPKYRKKAFYESKRLEIGQILRQLCEWKGITIIEAEVCLDHKHNTTNQYFYKLIEEVGELGKAIREVECFKI